MAETQIIDGKSIAKQWRLKIADYIKRTGICPKLSVIQVGDDPASTIYVANKQKVAHEVGILSNVYKLPADVSEQSVLDLIDELNDAKDVNGILLQLPVPPHLNADVLIERIKPEKDVDGLCAQNVGKMVTGKPSMIPCTPLGCLYLLKQTLGSLEGKHALVIGRSALVGRPLSQLLLKENCTVTQAHSKTVNLKHLCQEADIIISAVGKAGLIKGDYVKDGATIIDVGINRLDNGKIVGDILFLEMMGKAGYVTPVPGGVGPMTVAMLMLNVLKATDESLKRSTDLIFFE